MIIVRSFYEHVEWLFDLTRLPSVDELRPESCPLCGKLAYSPGERLGIVGHGTYRRQVLGVLAVARELVTLVRRYLCRGCDRTISVLAAELHPHRWYAAGVILEALTLHLLDGVSEREIRSRFGVVTESGSWRTLRRWRSELLVTLWHWFSRRLGVRGEAATREDGRRRLRQLLAEAAAKTERAAARVLLQATVHFQGFTWPLGHDPPAQVAAQAPP